MLIYVSSTIMFLHWHVVSFPEISHVVTCFLFVAGSFACGFTYSGHPVACAVAIKALKNYRYAWPFGNMTQCSCTYFELYFSCSWWVLCKNGHQRKGYSGPCQADCSKVSGWIRAFVDSPIIEEVCTSISELPNLPRGRRLLFGFKYMTTCFCTADTWLRDDNSNWIH